MGLLGKWRADREQRRKAAAYVRSLLAEPADADAAWLAEAATRGDLDHARWELRYARRALGLLSAQRDALDDRTASVVAAELAESFTRDPNIDPERAAIAERQLNDRLARYRDALLQRESGESTLLRLGRVLLWFAARGALVPTAIAAHGGEMLGGYLAEANEALRREFGVASLPEDVPPSAIAGTPR